MKRTLSIAALLAAGSFLSGCKTTILYEGTGPITIQGEAKAVRKKAVLKKLKAALKDKKIEINEKVQFEVNQAIIKPDSFELLNDVAQVMKENPQVKKVAIEGHASADGDDQQNLTLSDNRSKAVMAYLVTKGGVDAGRLTAEGFGEKRPIADNNTEDGREKNRRVEFNVVDDKDAKKKK